MDELDRIAKECTGELPICFYRLCVRNCELLKSLCDYPKELAKKFKQGYFREHPEVAYSCNLCELCKRLCPQGLDIAKMCLELREQLVAEGLAPLPTHRFVRVNQDWSTSENFALARPDPETGECKQVFFPGCNLSGYSPSLVIKTYDYLRQKLPGTGIVLYCCGEPSHSLGEQTKLQEIAEWLEAELKKLGTSEMIVACPLCYKTLKQHHPKLKLRFLAEVLLEVGLPHGVNSDGKKFSLHDSCSARWEQGIQDSVRSLVKTMGYHIEEMEHSRDLTLCCGMGGMVPFANMELAANITKRRADEASQDILTYCAACREALASEKPSIHILDLIFNPDWEQDRLKPPKTGKARRENQALLKTQLLDRFWKEV